MKDRKRILIIDDEEDVSAMVKLRLEGNGFLVLQAFTAQEGIKKAGENLPNLILLDVILPDADGYTTCQKLKSNQLTKNIPVVMFTASNLKELAKKTMAAGACDYAIKPFEPKELLDKINRALKGSE